ncbi:MAG: fatty acid kinase fatty acid binding subunit, partial [Actinomycetota bacterium]|nr:fatty acid kinase fatty acid binding subunit [Actinomycetota bacterium]
MPVRIVTDSACDLPEPICEELGVEVVPLTIRFGDREFVDRKELSVDAFWRELGASSTLPETAAPSVGAFEETFRRLSDDGADAIVCINLS